MHGVFVAAVISNPTSEDAAWTVILCLLRMTHNTISVSFQCKHKPHTNLYAMYPHKRQNILC